MTVSIRRLDRQAVARDLDRRQNEFLTACGTHGSAESRKIAPIAYGTLVNSQYMRIFKQSGNMYVEVGYLTDYAQYLEGTPQNPAVWSPKPAPKYGYAGRAPANAWNPQAKPAFLRTAFESQDAQNKFEEFKRRFFP